MLLVLLVLYTGFSSPRILTNDDYLGKSLNQGIGVMANDYKYVPFSQRNGFSQIPPQLKIGEVSSYLRKLFEYAINNDINKFEYHSGSYYRLKAEWQGISSDLHVKHFRRSISSYENKSYTIKAQLGEIIAKQSIGPLFDLLEFIIRHPNCSRKLKHDLMEAFVEARAAYRIVDGQIVAIGTEEQAAAFEAAISNTETVGASAARRHLVDAGVALRNGSWADSVRESIHAVEAMAKRINPEARTLGEALKTIERSGYIHGSLKAAFEKLYGYTNDEDGIRHALSDAESRVDETDALFMLGACASFVSYLIAREATHAANGQR